MHVVQKQLIIPQTLQNILSDRTGKESQSCFCSEKFSSAKVRLTLGVLPQQKSSRKYFCEQFRMFNIAPSYRVLPRSALKNDWMALIIYGQCVKRAARPCTGWAIIGDSSFKNSSSLKISTPCQFKGHSWNFQRIFNWDQLSKMLNFKKKICENMMFKKKHPQKPTRGLPGS